VPEAVLRTDEAVLRKDEVDLRSGSPGGAPLPPATPLGGDLAPRHGGSTVGTGPGIGSTVGGSTVGTSPARNADHPNLGAGSERPGVDTRGRDPSRNERSGMAGDGDGGTSGSTVRDAARRAGDAIERRLPGDADGDGR